jgi:hypothetical protein
LHGSDSEKEKDVNEEEYEVNLKLILNKKQNLTK